jgi:hypothetical protein
MLNAQLLAFHLGGLRHGRRLRVMAAHHRISAATPSATVPVVVIDFISGKLRRALIG